MLYNADNNSFLRATDSMMFNDLFSDFLNPIQDNFFKAHMIYQQMFFREHYKFMILMMQCAAYPFMAATGHTR